MTIEEIRDQASTITELRTRVAVAEQQAKDWQARHQGVTSLFEATQASYGELQGDYRRLSQAHQEMLLAHGSLLREHRAQSLTTNSAPVSPPSGDSGIEFTDENLCDRLQCPTTPPHRHITPTHPPKMPGTGVPPCPDRINDIVGSANANQVSDRINDIQAPQPQKNNQGSRLQAGLDDDFGDPDVNPTRANPRHEAQRRTADFVNGIFQNGREVPPGALPASMEPPASNTSEKGGAPGNPTKTLQQLRDSARIASKFADASGEAGPTVVDWNEEALNEAAEQGIAEGIEATKAGSDETRNTPDKQTEDR